MRASTETGVAGMPETKVSARQTFGIESELEVPPPAKTTEPVPDPEPASSTIAAS